MNRRALSPAQVEQLLTPMQRERVRFLRNQAHLEAWDIRRWLIRIFGFDGWDFRVLETALVYERVTYTPGAKASDPEKPRATVVYRVTGQLSVKFNDGTIGVWEDGAAGDAVNQPSIGSAHDFALKTAMSQALKRCAVNLGDQFGLSLYNKGRPTDTVVTRVLNSGRDEEPMPKDRPVVAGDMDPPDADADVITEAQDRAAEVIEPADPAKIEAQIAELANAYAATELPLDESELDYEGVSR